MPRCQWVPCLPVGALLPVAPGRHCHWPAIGPNTPRGTSAAGPGGLTVSHCQIAGHGRKHRRAIDENPLDMRAGWILSSTEADSLKKRRCMTGSHRNSDNRDDQAGRQQSAPVARIGEEQRRRRSGSRASRPKHNRPRHGPVEAIHNRDFVAVSNCSAATKSLSICCRRSTKSAVSVKDSADAQAAMQNAKATSQRQPLQNS